MTKDIFDRINIFAVVGASDNKEKVGYKIYKLLKTKGYTVYPVNPNHKTIQGDTAFPTLQSLPQIPDIVSVATPPEVSIDILKQAIMISIKTVWFQPGTIQMEYINQYDPEGNTTITGRCLWEELKKVN
jgi:predicted CoA-binding protein